MVDIRLHLGILLLFGGVVGGVGDIGQDNVVDNKRDLDNKRYMSK